MTGTRGKFIVFEGGEGGGKTTQLERSRHWLCASDLWAQLQGKAGLTDVVVTREPGGTELGQRLRQLILYPAAGDEPQAQTELLLYAADRAHHVTRYLQPQLAEGRVILCDRYTDSTVAYQGYGRQLSLDLIHQLNAIASLGLHSDLTLWFDVPVEQGLARVRQRGQGDRLDQATQSFHERVHRGFQDLAVQFPERIRRIDASLEPDQVFAQVQTVLTQQFCQWYPDLSLT